MRLTIEHTCPTTGYEIKNIDNEVFYIYDDKNDEVMSSYFSLSDAKQGLKEIRMQDFKISKVEETPSLLKMIVEGIIFIAVIAVCVALFYLGSVDL